MYGECMRGEAFGPSFLPFPSQVYGEGAEEAAQHVVQGV